MSISDDFIKKHSGKSPNSQKTNQQAAKPAGTSAADVFINKYGGQGTGGTGQNNRTKDTGSMQSWATSSIDLIEDTHYRSRDWFDDNEYKSRSDRIDSLISQAGNWRNQYKSNSDAVAYIDAVVDALSEAKTNAGSAREYYSQWQTADDYNGYLVRQKEYEGKKNFDLEAGRKEIDALERKKAELERSRMKPSNGYLTGTSSVGATPNGARFQGDYAGDSELAELDDLISQKKQYLNRAKYIQEGITLSGVINNEDFKDKSGYSSTKSEGIWDNMTSQFGMGYNDLTYEYINGKRNGMRQEIINKAVAYDADTEAFFSYDHMTDDQIATYNYHYAKDGKEAAEKYLDSIREELHYQAASERFGKMEGHTALELLFGIEAGVNQFQSGMKNLFNTGDDYIPQSATQMASGMVREDLADDGFKILGNSVGQVAYDAITTTANMAPSILTSVAIGFINPVAGQMVGSAMMGASAAGNAYQEALNQGFDKDQARGYGLLVGASEVVMEKVLGGISELGGNALGKFLTQNVTNADTALKMIAKKLGASALSEFSEEYLQEVLTPVFSNLMLGTDKEVKFFSAEALYSGLLGALTAGIMEGPSTISGEVNTHRTGKQLQNAGVSADRLAEIGKTFSADTAAYRLADKVNEKTGAYTIGRLFNEIGAGMSEQNVADITSALVAENMPEDIARKNAEIMAHIVAGGEVSDIQMRMIEKNDILAKVMREVIIDPNSAPNQRTGAYNEYLTALKNDSGDPAANGISAEEYSRMVEAAQMPLEAEETTGEQVAAEAPKAAQAAQAEPVTDREAPAATVSEKENIPASDRQMTGKLTGKESLQAAEESSVVAYRNTATVAAPATKGVPVTIEEASRKYGAQAGAMLHTYKPGQDVAQFDAAYRVAYNMGKSGVSLSYAMTSEAAGYLTQTQRELAHAAGKAAAQMTGSARKVGVSKKETAAPDGTKYRKVRFEGKVRKWTPKQKAEVAFIDFIAENFSGNTVHVYESYRTGDGKYVYTDSNGNVRSAPNGMYFERNGDIYLDLNAGNRGEGLVLNTFAHELYHHIETYSPEKAVALAEFLMQEIGDKTAEEAVHRQIEKAERAGFGVEYFMKEKGLSRSDAEKLVYDRALSDFVADSLETMFTEGDAIGKLQKLKKQDQGLFDKIREFVDKWLKKLREFYSSHSTISVEGDMTAHLEQFEKIQQMFVEALVDAGENYRAGLTPGREGTVVNSNGDPVAHATEDGSVLLSTRTYEEEGRDALRKYLRRCVKSNRMTKAEMQQMMDGIEEIYTVCKEFKDKYAPFSSWSDAAVVRDTFGRPVFSVVTPNGDYKMNLDFSLVCKKRRTLDAVFNEMSRRGIIDDFELGQKSVVKINEIIRKYGLETACALCFVDAKRFRQASMADQFTGLYNELVRSLVPAEQRDSIGYFNFSGYSTIKTVEDGIHTWDASRLDFSHLDEVMASYGEGTVEHKAAKYIKANAEGRKLLLRGDFMSSKGFDAVKTQNPDVLKLYNSKKGTGGPKAAFGDVQYLNEIIKKARTWTPEKAYAVGGVRVQSFSDYVPRMVFDYVQMIYDLAATKLPAHAYTKEALFVKQFGLTGIKINMSLIPAIAEGGIAPGLDADGNYMWAGESFDFETAKQIQKAPDYTENCGTICVGVSDRHIRKLLSDPDIRMVIPYHKSGLNPIVAHMNKIAEFTDYTSKQNTTVKETGSKAEEHFDFNEALHKLGKDADPKAVIRQYFDWCDERGYDPKFAQFRDHPNYYKLIEDFTLYDKDGSYVPQREVRAVFPKETDAFGSMKQLIAEGLEEDAIVEGKRDANLSAIVDEIQKSIPRTEAEISEEQVEQADRDLEADVKYSLRDVKVPTKTDLEKKDPMKVVDISTAKTKGTFAERRGQILKGAEKVISKPYLNRDTKTWIFLTKDSYTHSFNNLGTIQLNAAEHLPELIENAVLTHAEKPTHGSDYTDGVYTFFAAARAEKIMPVKLKVKEYNYAGQDLPKNIKAYFDSNPQGYASSYDTVVLEVQEIEKSPSGSAKDMNQKDSFLSPDELSTIKVADLLGRVKGEYEKYLPKFSDRDSDGNQLGEDQLEFFENSKARDENGSLYVLYHGSRSPLFTEFDMYEGVWLTPDQRYAEVYAEPWHSWRDEDQDLTGLEQSVYADPDYRVYKMYANITNPLDLGEINDEFDRGQMNRLAKLLGVSASRIRSISHHDGYQTVGFVYEVTRDHQFIEIAKEKGYDGFIASERGRKTFCAFNAPNQVKLTTNEVPSGFYDIRYSDRDESVSNRSLLANALVGAAQNDIEQQRLQEYQAKIDRMDAEERRLGELNSRIKDLSFRKGPRDTQAIRQMQEEAKKIANRISIYDKQLLRLEASKPLQNILEREKKLAYKRAEQKGREALAEYRKKVADDQRTMADRYRESRKAAVAKTRETAAKRDARAKLQKLVLDTSRWIAHPSKTDVKCPDLLKQPYAEFLNSIDMSSERLAKGGDPTKNDLHLANAMGSLATALEKVMTSQDPTQDTAAVLDEGYLDLPTNFIQKLREMTEEVKQMMAEGEYVVNSMTAEDVRKLSQMIRTLNHAIREVGTLYANMRFANVTELSVDSLNFMESIGQIQNTSTSKDFVQWDNALPYYAFKRFGEGGESVFEGLMDAQDKLAFLAQEIFNFQEKTWTGKEAQKWSEDTHTIDLPDGEQLTLTTADAMSIYCLSRRQQGMQHLLGGGVRVSGIQKGSRKAQDSRSTLTVKDIDAIISSLTDRQREVAEAIQGYMSGTCAEWGNEISMKRFLTREFNEQFYFPIESNDENLPTKDPSAQQSDLFRLLNISATKAIDPRANNEVIIRNIFEVFTGHASDMARLNAFGLPLLDYMKWLNYREKTVNENGQITVRGIRKVMENAYGKAAKSYVLNLIKDVNGRPSDNGDPTILMKWMRTAKTASVGSSLRVATLQITSYPRAALVLSPKSLALGLTKVPKIDKAKKYCGIALWKSFGFYDTNISRSIEDQMKGVKDVRQKIIELSLKGAEVGDALTWGALWNACEYEVAATKKYKVGSEEFNQAVGKKLREVVYRSQVVDSTLTRSQIMRSKRGMAQEAAAFMSEPTLSANILMDAGMEFNLARRQSDAQTAWKKTGKYVTRAIAVYSIGQLAAALMEGLWDAWRDDEDEKFLDKYLKAFGENLALDLVPLNKLPIISDVFEAVLAMFDAGYYSSDRMSTTWLTQAVSAADAWRDVLGGKSSITAYNALYKTARAISSFMGISISGVMREGVALWNNTAGAYDATWKILTYDRSNAERGKLLMDAILEGNTRQADSFRAEFQDEGAMRSALRSTIKDRYKAGEFDAAEAIGYLVEHAGMDEDEAYWKVEEWEYESETGDEFGKYNEFFAAVETGGDLQNTIKRYTDNGVEPSTLASEITKHFKPIYTGMAENQRTGVHDKLIGAMVALGKTREEAEDTIGKWVFEADYPELAERISYTQYKRWKTDGQPYGVSIDLYMDVAEFRDDETSGSVKPQDEVKKYILSVAKDRKTMHALWCCFYKASTSPFQ